jgi:hypothetical protein
MAFLVGLVVGANTNQLVRSLRRIVQDAGTFGFFADRHVDIQVVLSPSSRFRIWICISTETISSTALPY